MLRTRCVVSARHMYDARLPPMRVAPSLSTTAPLCIPGHMFTPPMQRRAYTKWHSCAMRPATTALEVPASVQCKHALHACAARCSASMCSASMRRTMPWHIACPCMLDVGMLRGRECERVSSCWLSQQMALSSLLPYQAHACMHGCPCARAASETTTTTTAVILCMRGLPCLPKLMCRMCIWDSKPSCHAVPWCLTWDHGWWLPQQQGRVQPRMVCPVHACTACRKQRHLLRNWCGSAPYLR